MSELWNKYTRQEPLTIEEIDCLYEYGLLTMGDVDRLLERAKNGVVDTLFENS